MEQKEFVQNILASEKEAAENAKQRAYEWLERLYESLEKDYTESAIKECLWVAENLTTMLAANNNIEHWERRLKEIEKEEE